MEQYFIWAQIIGFFAMCFSITAWQLKKPNHIVLCYVPSGTLWSLQYLILGAPLGALMNASSALKDGALGFIKPQYIGFIIGSFLCLIWPAGLYFFQNWYDIFPLLGTTIINLALLKRDDRPFISRAIIVGQICWMTYNVIVGAWMGLACGLLVSTSSMIGMARHENWEIGKCYRSFLPSLMRSLMIKPQTYP